MTLWGLPTSAVIGGAEYPINADYRDILDIFHYLNDPDRPEWLRWKIALGLFYEGDIPEEDEAQAMQFLYDFITCGQPDKPGPKLMDWDQDAQIIVADLNKVAGTEIRAVPFLHWWTFMGYFNAIGEGQLSTIVSVREKLSRGKPLEKWEKEYYHKNRERIDLRQKYSSAEESILEQFKAQLGGAQRGG